jgi:hypothetical protein
MTTAIEIHTHLLDLQAERSPASIEGIAMGSAYMADLDGGDRGHDPRLRRGCRHRDRDVPR